ncbi:MAG: hypothetical protein ABSH48_28410 [Verrucomicrobiota bacterium]|jgi:hypothetical protein
MTQSADIICRIDGDRTPFQRLSTPSAAQVLCHAANESAAQKFDRLATLRERGSLALRTVLL